jgi:ribosome-associated protein
MMGEAILQINDDVSIPEAELSFRFSRSSGPGGQHAQKSSTRVELVFDLANSPSLSDRQRTRALKGLAGYVDSAGVLHLTAQSERSQLRNREEVVARFQSLLCQALKRRRRRKATKPTAKSKEQRLQEKHRHSDKKKSRGKVQEVD